jgi:hypothetical protein
MAAPVAFREQERAYYTRCTTPACSLVFPVTVQYDGYVHKHCCSTCFGSAGHVHTGRCFWNADHHVLNTGNELWTDEEWRAWYIERALIIERRVAARLRARQQQQ